MVKIIIAIHKSFELGQGTKGTQKINGFFGSIIQILQLLAFLSSHCLLLACATENTECWLASEAVISSCINLLSIHLKRRFFSLFVQPQILYFLSENQSSAILKMVKDGLRRNEGIVIFGARSVPEIPIKKLVRTLTVLLLCFFLCSSALWV